MASIKDVAKEAGVSVATVSRLLNDRTLVSQKTATRVNAAIQKLSYEPNNLARNFRRKESRIILVLTPNVTNPYYAHILSGISDKFAQLGYSSVIYTTEDNPNREKSALEMLKTRRADGAILLAHTAGQNELLAYYNDFPIVQCSEYDPNLDIPHVSIDNYRATQDAIEHLISIGHERIAMISSMNTYISTTLRQNAFEDTMRRYGLPINPEYIAHGSRDYSLDSGKVKARELLSLAERPTAIFCVSDTLALGAIIAAREMGLRVPEDVSVIGFDDVEYTVMLHPYISTVAQPCYDLGQESAKLLFTKIAREADVPKAVLLEHKLVLRESSCAPHNNGLTRQRQMAPAVDTN